MEAAQVLRQGEWRRVPGEVGAGSRRSRRVVPPVPAPTLARQHPPRLSLLSSLLLLRAAGRTIVSGPEVATRFFVLVEGLASLERQHRGVLAEPRLQYSGW